MEVVTSKNLKFITSSKINAKVNLDVKIPSGWD